jgi:non-specific serine/threonine protein kinase
VAEALREVTGITIWPGNVADYQRSLSLVRDQLDEEEIGAAWAAGRALPLHQAVAEVLAEEPSSQSPGAVSGLELTRREWEVVALVAEGLTNRQIGARLFITEGTARLHVKHILQKLGFTSRAQIAVWAVEHGLTAG